MRKFSLTFSAALLSMVCFVSASGQSEKFSVVKLKGSDVSNALASPKFSYFDFTFKEAAKKSYILEGYAMDATGKPLGKPITLSALTEHPGKPLKNLDIMGHFRLTKNTILKQNVDGSEDYILTPRKCKDKKDKSKSLDYVSYWFSNRFDEVSDDSPALDRIGYLGGKVVIAFTFNPSPPY
jgi:hypothetical protein